MDLLIICLAMAFYRASNANFCTELWNVWTTITSNYVKVWFPNTCTMSGHSLIGWACWGFPTCIWVYKETLQKHFLKVLQLFITLAESELVSWKESTGTATDGSQRYSSSLFSSNGSAFTTLSGGLLLATLPSAGIAEVFSGGGVEVPKSLSKHLIIWGI